jgi:hypothetical protein
MAHGYTPGLCVAEHATVRKHRRLPIAGTVLVRPGEKVHAEDVVARAELPGDVAAVNVANALGVAPQEVERYMLKKAGDPAALDEVIAETRPLIKWFRSAARSPIAGSVESISRITGQVMIRAAPKPVDVSAYVDGTVVEVQPGEGAVVETAGALVQGIFGVGGETCGEVALAAGGPDAVIGPGDLGEDLAGKIVVAGALVTSAVCRRAAEIGLAALVCGGFHDADLRAMLGYDLGVAITGHEKIQPILIMTEGFGRIAMARATYELLASRAGRRASANGTTQIRAGVMRPEIIIPSPGGEPTPAAPNRRSDGMAVGSSVRIIRQPGFGRLGTVRRLPAGVQAVQSEARVRVVEVELVGGEVLTVPRANIEVIET